MRNDEDGREESGAKASERGQAETKEEEEEEDEEEDGYYYFMGKTGVCRKGYIISPGDHHYYYSPQAPL